MMTNLTLLKQTKSIIHDLKIITPVYSDAMNYIQQLTDTGQFSNPKIGYLIGESGKGKTKICKAFKDKYPDETNEESDIRRIIYIKLTGDASKGEILKELYLELMGKTQPQKGNNAEKEKTIIGLLEDLKTELVIIDEAQHAMSAQFNEHGKTGTFINMLKTISDDSKVPILVSGIPGLESLRVMEGKNAGFSRQLKRRSFLPHFIRMLTLKETQKILVSFADKLEALNITADALKEPSIVCKFYLASSGAIGIISDLIQAALIEEKGRISINAKSIYNASKLSFEEFENPFTYNDRVLKIKLDGLKKEAA
ncbi:TniB family NTP-binding protein [Paraglaciecola hydrolytica]|uniref:AAA+ ATPase domain-containing protein n=1 Tax=Paraglaciecola hydrolytica TaxID=1799789 RepID=A0A136A2Y9_9ALTE|nr:TniB family NTP-binding protein [Paraglaciecola hydrolytica]KXI29601.1 hypothetical protein AX660_05980 [Paraglaciecola hydrolytica]